MPESSWKSQEYYDLIELRGLLQSAVAELPYFQSLPHANVAKYQGTSGPILNFSSYDYLGLGADPRSKEYAIDAVERYGCSAGASRLAAGQLDIHETLESALAEWLGAESSLAFVGGYATNVSVLGFLFCENDTILCDQLVHNSINAGARLSRAECDIFPHNDAKALEILLDEHKHRSGRVVVCIEGLYSMDGDLPPLPEIIDLKKEYGFLLYVDEAHSIGTVGATGRGVTEHFGLPREVIDIQMGTLSKTFGSCGGFIAGSADLIEYLKFACPGFVYSTGLPGPLAAAALGAVELLASRPELVGALQLRGQAFRRALGQVSPYPTTPIVPVFVEDAQAYSLSDRLKYQGVRVFPILFPGVPKGAARLRFFLSVKHSIPDLFTTADLINGMLHNTIPSDQRCPGNEPSTMS